MSASGPQPDLLVVAAAELTMATLVSRLADHGVTSDIVGALDEARTIFLAKGGHRALVLAPDLAPSVAQRVIDSLTGVDPELPVVAFTREDRRAGRRREGVRRVSYHPSSRAAVGAILKIVRES